MAVEITKSDIAWGYAGYALSSGANLILMPFVLRYLSKTELGLWYTFLGVNSFAMLLDFGFALTIMRNVSFCWGGAQAIIKEGVDGPPPSGSPNYALLYLVERVSRAIYLYIGLCALALLSTAGTAYIVYVTRGSATHEQIVAWFCFTIGAFANLYYAYWGPMLKGVGAVKESQQALVVSRCAQLLVSSLGLVAGFGIIAVSVGFLVAGITTRVVSRRWFYRYNDIREQMRLHAATRVPGGQLSGMMRAIWHNARRQGLASMGSFLIQRGDILICSAFLGLAASASYGLTQQLYTFVTAVSAILFNSFLPALNEARLLDDRARLSRVFGMSLAACWLVLIVGTASMVFVCRPLLMALKSHAGVLPPGQAAFMGLFLLLEINHMLFAAYITTANTVPMVRAYLLTGVSVVFCELLLVRFTPLGLWGLLLAHFAVQLAYNNWKWPSVVLGEFGVSLRTLLWLGCRDLWRAGRAALGSHHLRGKAPASSGQSCI